MQRALELAPSPAEIIEISAKLEAFEHYMHACGLYSYSIEDNCEPMARVANGAPKTAVPACSLCVASVFV